MRKIFPYVLSSFMVASFSAFAQSTTEQGARSVQSQTGAPVTTNAADAPKRTEQGARSADSRQNEKERRDSAATGSTAAPAASTSADAPRTIEQGARSATGSTAPEKKY
jgi:hypothetical protein